MNREMRGWRLGERLDLLLDNGDSDNNLDSDEDDGKNVKRMTTFVSCEVTRVSGSPTFSPSLRKSRSRVKKNLEVCHAKEKLRCPSIRWHMKTKWQSSPVDAGAQSSPEKWRKRALERRFPHTESTVLWQKTRRVPGSKVVRKVEKKRIRYHAHGSRIGLW